MKHMSKYLNILYNKYFISSAFFLVYITFFDDNKLINQSRLSSELNSLKDDKEYYLNEIKKNKEVQELLMSDVEQLERFAREEYRMKRDNEDVYVFEIKNKEE